MQAGAGGSLEEVLQTLTNLILRTDPPKGEPFPQIPGPKKDDKVQLSNTHIYVSCLKTRDSTTTVRAS